MALRQPPRRGHWRAVYKGALQAGRGLASWDCRGWRAAHPSQTPDSQGSSKSSQSQSMEQFLTQRLKESSETFHLFYRDALIDAAGLIHSLSKPQIPSTEVYWKNKKASQISSTDLIAAFWRLVGSKNQYEVHAL